MPTVKSPTRTEHLAHDDLVLRARAGDVDAFSTLTAGVTNRLYAVAKLILRDDDQAADAVQDALLRAWVDLRALRQPEKFDAWLHRILVRACYRLAGRRRSANLVELNLAIAPATTFPDSQDDLARRDQLERGFRRLTPDQRAVLVLRHYLGLSTDECAEILGIPPGTVQSRLHLARDAMRAALAADERPGPFVGEVAR